MHRQNDSVILYKQICSVNCFFEVLYAFSCNYYTKNAKLHWRVLVEKQHRFRPVPQKITEGFS